MSHHPKAGARFLFVRQVVDDGQASYCATIYTPEQAFAYRVAINLAGEVTATAVAAEAQPDARGQLVAIAKRLARAAARNLAGQQPPWPRRVLRWKGPGRGGIGVNG
jgi:hypothetical protein